MVYAFVETQGGVVSSTAAEVITAARALGDVTVLAVAANNAEAEQIGTELGQLGATSVFVGIAADLASRGLVLPATDTISLVAGQTPAPIVVAGGVIGNEIAGRAAARLASGVLVGVVGINADGSANQSIFGDTIDVVATAGGASPVYAVRPGAIVVPEIPAATCEVQAFEIPAAGEKDVQVTNFTPAASAGRPDLTAAKVVVAGGRGVGSTGMTELVEPLADALGGAVGVTRDVVDAGDYDGQYQVGQTGVTVSPDLYIALGISGAIQHKSGMQTSRTIIAVNIDEDAPIFEIADLGVIADVEEFVPELLAALKARG